MSPLFHVKQMFVTYPSWLRLRQPIAPLSVPRETDVRQQIVFMPLLGPGPGGRLTALQRTAAEVLGKERSWEKIMRRDIAVHELSSASTRSARRRGPPAMVFMPPLEVGRRAESDGTAADNYQPGAC